ncbi:MAG: transketolase [Acidimicrobiaceae bacterium]|nr:MAG: transketolase [Acidimicrobiaceae bacterium]
MSATGTMAGPHAGDASGPANALRALAMDAVQAANSGHPGMPMGMADVGAVLFTEHLTFDPTWPEWPDRDRFVLSAGHGSMLLYAALHLLGVEGMSADQLRRFRQIGALTAGHPEYGHCPGVETTTGPLGQGIATAVGMAIAERMANARFGDALVDHRTFVIAGDGCLMEGISHEAIDLAGHLRLGRLVALWDDNGISIDGSTSLTTSTDQPARFTAAGWHVTSIDGHDRDAIRAALAAAEHDPRPSLIACRTTIGQGSPNMAGTAAVHGSPLGADEVAAARAHLEWSHQPFEVPDEVREPWRTAGRRGTAARLEWQRRCDTADAEQLASFQRGAAWTAEAEAVLAVVTDGFRVAQPSLATRQSSQQVLEALAGTLRSLVGGSADLTGSNGTRASSQRAVSADDFSGSYVHWGVREHAMAAAMNGIALHGGFLPYGGSFLAFADYCRPAIRLSALMGTGVVYVMTHDSIGLGEDGPTHQPVEQLASLRAIPNLRVFRPADAIETAQAWGAALRHGGTPSVLCLSRQALATLPRQDPGTDGVARGAYLVSGSADRDVTLLATGSEVAIAVAAAAVLADGGIRAAVVSMPCWELFDEQDVAYRVGVLGTAPRVAIEAAARFGWDRWLGPADRFVGMSGFGASGPAAELYEHFGITATAVADAARAALTDRERSH